jgi:streptogramin lyase
MDDLLRKGIVFVVIIFFIISQVVPVVAQTVSLQEAHLDPSGELTRIYTGADGSIFVIDATRELWKVNPNTGAYYSYFPLGGDALADIALAPSNMLWWTDDATSFGSLNLSNHQAASWSVGALIPELKSPPNLGPVFYHNNQLWLASWYDADSVYGLFRFNPSNRQLCLFEFPNGLYATDLIAHGGLLWALDWRSGSSDSLFSLDPATGRLGKYDTGRNVQMFANLVSDGSLFWWAEDTSGGAVVRFDPVMAQMTVFSLPANTWPRNISLRGGMVWYTDKNGAFGRLDPNTAAGTSTTLTGQVLAEGLTPTCTTLGAVTPSPSPHTTGTLLFNNFNSNQTTPQSGLQVYSLPAGAQAYGIAGTTDYVWVSDPGRQKLIRLPVEPPPSGDFQVYLPLILH